jgi:hypothetical protein
VTLETLSQYFEIAASTLGDGWLLAVAVLIYPLVRRAIRRTRRALTKIEKSRSSTSGEPRNSLAGLFVFLKTSTKSLECLSTDLVFKKLDRHTFNSTPLIF